MIYYRYTMPAPKQASTTMRDELLEVVNLVHFFISHFAATVETAIQAPAA